MNCKKIDAEIDDVLSLLAQANGPDIVGRLIRELEFLKQEINAGRQTIPLPRRPRRILWFVVRDRSFDEDRLLSEKIDHLYSRLFAKQLDKP